MARAMRAEQSRDALKAAQQAKRMAKRARMVTAARRKEGGDNEPSRSAVAASAWRMHPAQRHRQHAPKKSQQHFPMHVIILPLADITRTVGGRAYRQTYR